MNPRKRGIEQPCYIAEGVEVPEDAYVGAFAYIGRNVRLGKGVQIYPQVYIGDNVRIGDNTILYPGVRVYYNCQVGQDCILHAGVVIGADGFGFEPDKAGVNRKVPQIGAVIIEDDVEIGANSAVDRAMMGNTVVHRNTKIDNLVQVAHNVEVGASTFMCAQSGVAGSTKRSGRRSRSYRDCGSVCVWCASRRSRIGAQAGHVPGNACDRCGQLAPFIGRL